MLLSIFTIEYLYDYSYPYVYLVLDYDVLDLLSVKKTEKKRFGIYSPYGEWELTFPLARDNANIPGAANDPVTQKIYTSQDGGDTPGCCGHLPLIHAFKLNLKKGAPDGLVPSLHLLLLQKGN